MTPTPKRAEPLSPAIEEAEPLEYTGEGASDDEPNQSGEWLEAVPQIDRPDAGGRQVLGVALIILAGLWIAYSAWSAGRAMATQALTSPLVTQWVAVASGPLALLALLWLIFGRTRRKESEQFTRSVIAMRSEAQSLHALLQILSERMNDSRAELVSMTEQLMQLGDETTGKLSGITSEFDNSAKRLSAHGEALDRAAESARNDIGVLLVDLPRAEETTQSLGQELRSIASDAATNAAQLATAVGALEDRGDQAAKRVVEAADLLSSRLAEIESAGTRAIERVGEADVGFRGTIEWLLGRTAEALDEIRAAIDVQSEAVSSLVEQASAGLGKAGAEAAESLSGNLAYANETIASLSRKVAEQDIASQKMIAEIDRGLALIDERFQELASHGDERANHFLDSLTRARSELDTLAAQASSQDLAIGTIAERTVSLRQTVEDLTNQIRDGLGVAIGEAQGGADRLTESAGNVRPEIAWIRDAAVEADERLRSSRERVAEQGDQLAALLASVDEGVESTQRHVSELGSALEDTERAATSLGAETAPALVSALVQVKEAAAHAADRAREAIEAVIPASAGKLSEETRNALERVIRESVEERLRNVDQVAAQAVQSAQLASERLTQQIVMLGRGATALEQHVEETRKKDEEKDSEAFARRVSLLIDSMHSAAIDVGKILSDEIDEKAWGSYLKGNRGVFTARAVRLIGGSETRALRAHYESDSEFQRSVNRYIHDFEAMLRRVMCERDGGIIAVTLMSSDMGKLYAALAQAIDKKR